MSLYACAYVSVRQGPIHRIPCADWSRSRVELTAFLELTNVPPTARRTYFRSPRCQPGCTSEWTFGHCDRSRRAAQLPPHLPIVIHAARRPFAKLLVTEPSKWCTLVPKASAVLTGSHPSTG